MEAGPARLAAADGRRRQVPAEGAAGPGAGRPRVFVLAPVVVLISTFLLYVVIPVGPGAVGENLDTGIFFALAVSSLSVIGILMAGWASANKYSLIGGLRAAGQLIAYELPLVLAVVGVVMMAGTLTLQGIVARPGPRSSSSASRPRHPLRPPPVRRLRPLPDRRPGRADPDAVRHADRRVRAGRRLPDRVQRPALPLLLHRRVRHRLRPGRHRRHAVPRWLVDPLLPPDRRSGATCSASACCSPR